MIAHYVVIMNIMLPFYPQMGAGFGVPPSAVPASFTPPVSGGLDDLFDLGGGVGMPVGAYSPPKTVSFDNWGGDILLNNN